MITKQEIKEYMKFNNLDIIELKSNKFIRSIKYIWFSFTMAFTSTFIYIFQGAYLNPSFKIIVDINYYGEAYFEALFIIIYLLLSLILTYDYFKKR